MKTVYVAGPVVRLPTLPEISEVERIYGEMQGRLAISGCRVKLPLSDPYLEFAAPPEFYRQIESRIAAADVVITVLPEVNPSSGIESTMAAFMNKPQYILTRTQSEVPRLLKGLPNLKGVYKVQELHSLLAQVTRLDDENPPTEDEKPPRENPPIPPAMTMGA